MTQATQVSSASDHSRHTLRRGVALVGCLVAVSALVTVAGQALRVARVDARHERLDGVVEEFAPEPPADEMRDGLLLAGRADHDGDLHAEFSTGVGYFLRDPCDDLGVDSVPNRSIGEGLT